MERSVFEAAYRQRPPWEIDRPQPAFVRLAESGVIRGRILDVGCGTGENAIFLAERGHDVVGIDFIDVAVAAAKNKAASRNLNVHFEVGDALELGSRSDSFDSVIDSGLFHTFSDEQRPRFVSGLSHVLGKAGRLFVLCFSELEPGLDGPRRVTQREIRDAFRDGWLIDSIESSRYAVREQDYKLKFTAGGAHAWLASLRRGEGSNG